MFLDLHVHTDKYSPCSSLSPHDAVMTAKAMKLDGILIAEHDIVWDEYEIEELKDETRSHDLVILRGQEIAAYNKGVPEGHILVFGFYEILHHPLSAEEIIRLVHEAGGVAIAAHPFRTGYGLEDRIFNLDLDAIEVLNSRTSIDDNKKAEEAQKKLDIPSIGGSDAHMSGEVGRCLTFFEAVIKTESDIIREISEKSCIAVPFSDLCEKYIPK